MMRSRRKAQRYPSAGFFFINVAIARQKVSTDRAHVEKQKVV
jgi:hypothetical protein